MPLRILVAASRLAEAPGAEVVVFEAADLQRDAAGRGFPSSRPSEHARRYLRLRDVDAVPGLGAAASFDGVLLAGAEGMVDIERLGARLAVAEADSGRPDGTLRIVPLIDTARGVLALNPFLPLPRLAGIACDPDRLAASLRCAIDGPAISQARALTVLAAAACGVPAILVAHATDTDSGREGFGAIFLDDRL